MLDCHDREPPMIANRIRRIAVAVAGLAAAAASAQQPAPPASAFAASNLTPKGVQAMADNCAICHGPRGRPVAGSSLAPLAGRNAASTIEAMKAFRDGKRDATVMHQISKGFSDAEIAAMAAYFAAQSKEAP
jgi:sulfide dehydrogenase cytochrome subunit